MYIQPTGPGHSSQIRAGPPVLRPFSYTKATGKKEGINFHEKNTQKERIFTMAKGLVHWHLTFQSPLLGWYKSRDLFISTYQSSTSIKNFSRIFQFLGINLVWVPPIVTIKHWTDFCSVVGGHLIAQEFFLCKRADISKYVMLIPHVGVFLFSFFFFFLFFLKTHLRFFFLPVIVSGFLKFLIKFFFNYINKETPTWYHREKKN